MPTVSPTEAFLLRVQKTHTAHGEKITQSREGGGGGGFGGGGGGFGGGNRYGGGGVYIVF
jgi:hypothetical protein